MLGNGNTYEPPAKSDPSVKRVIVGIPLKGHTPPESYHDRMKMLYFMGGTEVEQKLKGVSPRYEFILLTAGEIFVPYAREQLADFAVKWDADFLFMCDDDMTAPHDLFYQLVRNDVDIVAPLAFTRNPPHKPVIYTVVDGFDPVVRKQYYINNVVHNYPKDTLVECDAVGFGAVLIKTEVLKRMKKPYFMGSHGTGEDIHFCVMAKKLGFRIYMDTRVKLGHLSHPVIVTEDYAQKFNKMTQDEKDKYYGFYTKYADQKGEPVACP